MDVVYGVVGYLMNPFIYLDDSGLVDGIVASIDILYFDLRCYGVVWLVFACRCLIATRHVSGSALVCIVDAPSSVCLV